MKTKPTLFGQFVRLGRQKRKWSLRDMERETGVSNPLLSQIETGKVRNPTIKTVFQILHAFEFNGRVLEVFRAEDFEDA